MNDMPDLDFIYEDSDKYMTEVSGNGSHWKLYVKKDVIRGYTKYESMT